MKRILLSATMIVLLATTALFTVAQPQDNPDDEGKLTVPWNEFKKLLNLDEDQIVISLETFQKLLAQTGTRTTPPHTMMNGNVVLTRTEFKKLVAQMKTPVYPDVTPPFDHLITKAIYAGKMQENSTAFTAVFNVHVLKKDAYVKVPILPQSIALADMKVDGEQALVICENGYHHVVLPKPGEFVVTASYTLKSSLEKGPHKIDLAIRQTPITLLKLELPLKNIDVEIPQAQQVLTSPRGNTTVVSAVIGQGTYVSVRWRKKVAVAEKVPPKLYSEVHHLISIQDDALKTSSDINYTILHSEVDAVQLVIPENVNVLAVSGEGVGEWQEATKGNQRLLLIPFTYGKKGAATVRVTTETAFSESGLSNAFFGIKTLGTVRETGFIGIELATSAEVIVRESEGLEKVVVQKLPQPLVNKSARPLIMGFKYLKHPYSLVFDIQKHEKIGVPVASINFASVVTLFTEDGKIVNRLVYQIRNSAKQFLEIQLPENADVWSVFVGNQPVESSMNGQGKLLVPLIRSRSVDNRLDTFPVEVIYCTVQNRFSPFGSQVSALPAADLLTSQLIWSVYLPNDYSYVYFRSTLEKEEIIRGLNIFAGARRQYDEDAMKEFSQLGDEKSRAEMQKIYKGKDYRSYFRNVPMEEDQIASQVDAELEFSGRLEGLSSNEVPQAPISGGAVSTGVLPIQIRVPTSGQVYRFAKTIIKTDDPLTFSVIYTRLWIISLLKWISSALIILFIYLNRKRLMRIARWSGEKLNTIAGWLKKHESIIKRYAQSNMMPFALFGLVVIFWNISAQLTLLFFFLFWVSVVYQIHRLWKKRMQTRAASKTPAGQHGTQQ
ncbi:MAG: hypothetical protein GTO29_08345 [Candidatus Latescibacteria bacterium]|nr:hypothetical protein [Candidatus Latescibacterota bacterium]NIO56172.1 hypothetical protein [Candidatus Latescibacterota bacterium]